MFVLDLHTPAKPVHSGKGHRFVLLTPCLSQSTQKPRRKRTKRLRPAYGYRRVSTLGQQEHGNGLNDQREAINAFANELGYRIVRWFDDVHTSMDDPATKRPGSRDALLHQAETKYPIIVDGLDRFSRDLDVVDRDVASGRVRVISTRSGDGASRAIIMGEAARGAAELERIRRTTTEGMARARADGAQIGNPRIHEAQKLGTEANVERANKEARTLLPIVRELRSAGRRTRKEIAEGLNTAGHRTTTGKLWTPDNLRRPLGRITAMDLPRPYDSDPLWGSF